MKSTTTTERKKVEENKEIVNIWDMEVEDIIRYRRSSKNARYLCRVAIMKLDIIQIDNLIEKFNSFKK